MQLLLMNYCWIFVCLLFATGNGLDCDKLTQTLVLENDPNVCIATSNQLLGNYGQFVTVDFSKADNKVLNTFLQQFDTIQAAIVIENSNLDTINFGRIGEWGGKRLLKNGTFISIRNNPQLAKFEWDSTVPNFQINAGQVDVYAYVYNNPLLSEDSLRKIKDAIAGKTKIKDYIQSEPDECWFEDPRDRTKYMPPIPEILKNCRSIKGDLILAGGKLEKELKLSDDACLKLTGVDMTGVTLVASKGKGTEMCKDGTTKSEVTGNAHLCGQELKKLVDYFPAGSAVKIEMDPGTCTIDCNDVTDVIDKYNYCKIIKADASIIDWFKNEDLKGKLSHLVSSEELTISSGSMAKVSLPKLANAKGLIIRDNDELTDLELPALKTVTKLIIEGNPKLTLVKINKALEKVTPAASTVECRLTAADVIWNINDLRLCTTVIGPLTLEGLKHFDPTKFKIKKVVGCVKIKDTQLRSLDFLNIDITGCTGQHVVTGTNPSLCKIDHLDSQKKVPVSFEGNYIKNCGKICTSLNEDNCELFYGLLTFNATTQHSAKKLKKLKIILGGLKIDKSPAESIDIPNLKEIQSPTAPALKITDNLALKSLTMKKLKNIIVTDRTSPRVLITGNKKLKKETLKQFLPSGLYDQCVDKDPICQYVDGVKDNSSGSGQTVIILCVVGGILAISIITGGAVGFYCYWNWKKKKQKALVCSKKSEGEEEIGEKGEKGEKGPVAVEEKQKEKAAVENQQVIVQGQEIIRAEEPGKAVVQAKQEKEEDAADGQNIPDEKKPQKWRNMTDYFYFKLLGMTSIQGSPYVPICPIPASQLPERALEILFMIVTPLFKDDFLYWRCQFKGIADMKDSKGGNKELSPAMYNKKMLLNRNVHLVNSEYLQQYPAFLQALIDKIEVIPENAKDDKPDDKKSNGKNSRKPGGGENATKNEKTTEKTSANKTNPKPKENYKTVHIIHIGAGFKESIDQIRNGTKEKEKKKKKNTDALKSMRMFSGKGEESKEMTAKSSSEQSRYTTRIERAKKKTSGTAAGNKATKSGSRTDSSGTKNEAKNGERLKKDEKKEEKKEEEEKERENRPDITFVENNRIRLTNVDGYSMFELTGALIFYKKDGKKHTMEVLVLEIIPLMMDDIMNRVDWRGKREKAKRPIDNGADFSTAEHLFHSMRSGSSIPWPTIVKYALENNIIIHTEQADYYLLVYYFIATFDALSGTYGPPKKEHFSHFAHGIYHTYTQMLYNNQFNSGSANAWYIWATSMCQWFLNICVNKEKNNSKALKQFTSYDLKGLYKNVGESTYQQENDLDKMEKHTYKNKCIKWAELYELDPTPENPLFNFVELIDPFDLPTKEIKYDPVEPWQGLEAAQIADGSLTTVIKDTDKFPMEEQVYPGATNYRPFIITM